MVVCMYDIESNLYPFKDDSSGVVVFLDAEVVD